MERTDAKIAQLQSILNSRIKDIKRWHKISVYDYNSAPTWIKDLIGMDKESGCLHWNGRKKNNIHEYEIKEFPMNEIDTLIKRNEERLKNERKIYK